MTRHTKVEEAEQKAAQEISRLQELAYELQVEQAMTREVIAVSPRSTMAEFGQVLRANRISGTPVVEAGRMIGIASIEDLVKALAAGEPDATGGKKMTPIPVTLRADEPLVHAVSKFTKLRFGRFPVVNREGDLVGRGYASDLPSCVLVKAQQGNLWVTLQAHPNIVAVASLLDLAVSSSPRARNSMPAPWRRPTSRASVS